MEPKNDAAKTDLQRLEQKQRQYEAEKYRTFNPLTAAAPQQQPTSQKSSDKEVSW